MPRADVPPALRTLLETSAAIVRRAPSGRVALARALGAVPPESLPSGLRRPVMERLEEAHAQATEPVSFKDVERVLKSAWGKPPGRVLDDLDREPLAVTPAAQVHRAELDGATVAVKVQRPGLAAAVRNDLALLDAVAGPLGAVLPSADAGALLREARESALDELDLEHEAGQQRQVRRALRGVDGVVVPETHTDLAADDVLVSELLDGPTLAEERPADPAAVGRALIDAHLTAWRDASLALTDPRPGHVVLLSDGRVGLLGTGVARRVPRERLDPALDGLRALHDGDRDAFAAAAVALGVLDEDRAREAFDHAMAIAGDLFAGRQRLDAPALGAAADAALGRLGPLSALALGATPDAADLAPGRMAAQLVALLARLEAGEDWAAVALS